MSSWLESIYANSIQFGMNQTNRMIANALSMILNMYGSKLLKIDNEIIKSNECSENYDTFYLHSFNFKEIKQEIGLNIVEIVNGTIFDAKVIVPWKALQTEQTEIQIPNIELNIRFTQNADTLMLSNHSIANSYLMQNFAHSDTNLIEIYHEISDALTKYFNKIIFRLKRIQIRLDNFIIIVTNCCICNRIVSISTIDVSDLNGILLANIRTITFDIDANTLTIDKINIDAKIVEYIPDYYADDSKKIFSFKIIINEFKLDALCVDGLRIEIDPNQILIFLTSAKIGDFAQIENPISSSEFKIDLKSPISNINFIKKISIRVNNLDQLFKEIDLINEFALELIDKYVVITLDNNIESNVESNVRSDTVIRGVNLLVFNCNNIFNITIDKIILKSEQINFIRINIESDSTVLSVDTINIAANKPKIINLTNSRLTGKNFELIAISTKFQLSEHMLEIIFENSTTTNIIELIEFVKHIIPKSDGDNHSHTLDVLLTIKKSNIYLKIEQELFDIAVNNCVLNISTLSASNVELNIIMNNFLIGKIIAPELSEKNMLFESIKISIDPEIFDQLNYLMGTLSIIDEVSTEGNYQLQKVLSKSVISHNPTTFKNELNTVINQIINNNSIQIMNIPYVNTLAESFISLHRLCINDYCPNNLEVAVSTTVKVNSINIYLFDNMTKCKIEKKTDSCFLCIVIKYVELIKILEASNKYQLSIKTCAVIDTNSTDPEWKYFIKFIDKVANINFEFEHSIVRLSINIYPLVASIKEECLLHLLAFFSNHHQVPQNSIYRVEYFKISAIDILINYYPLILKNIGADTNAFSLNKHRIILSPLILMNLDNFDKLFDQVATKWKSDINPENILQFIPNVKIIQPYAVPIMDFFKVITKYFKNSSNKWKIRALTRNITLGTNLLSELVQCGVTNIWDFFA